MNFLPNESNNPDLDQVKYFYISDGTSYRVSPYSDVFYLNFTAFDEKISLPIITADEIRQKTLEVWESGNFYPYPDPDELEREIELACDDIWEGFGEEFDTILEAGYNPHIDWNIYYNETSLLKAKDKYEELVRGIAERLINEWLAYNWNFEDDLDDDSLD